MEKITYKSAGVNIDELSLFKQKINQISKNSKTKEVLKDLGSFGSLFEFQSKKYKNPVLVSSADGVGTKLKIAQLVNKHDTVGIDLVAMNTNDILCLGAKPLFFLDYIAFAKLDRKTLLDIIKGINKGCMRSGCSLIGGETAQMPGMYKEGEYDLAGFCVGVVEKDRIIDGRFIKDKDLILGLASSGLHSNGFSLVRKVLDKKELIKYSKILLTPTRIYVKAIFNLLENFPYGSIKAIAHISGGSFYNKVSKVLPKNFDAVIEKNRWNVPKIFQIIQDKGNIKQDEMYSTFNMGIGLVLIINPKYIKKAMERLSDFGIDSFIIGEILRGSGKTVLI